MYVGDEGNFCSIESEKVIEKKTFEKQKDSIEDELNDVILQSIDRVYHVVNVVDSSLKKSFDDSKMECESLL